MAKGFMEQSQTRKKGYVKREHGNAGNLFKAPTEEGQQDGHYSGHVMKSSLLTEMSERKSWLKGGALFGGLTWFFLRRFRAF